MKTFIAVVTAFVVLSFSAAGQEMQMHHHQMDSTKVEKHMIHRHKMDTSKVDTYTCTMHPEVITHKPGKCPRCGMTLIKIDTKKVKEVTKKINAIEAEVYTCPMHPDMKSDKPGKCPKCKMNLVKEKKDN
jgi:hypothetical protein